MRDKLDCLGCDGKGTLKHDTRYMLGYLPYMGKPYTCVRCGSQVAYSGKTKNWFALRPGKLNRRASDKAQGLAPLLSHKKRKPGHGHGQ